MNGRIYDPSIGRMLQVDPLADSSPQGWNRYSYAANNPLSLTDPTGYSWWRDILAIAIVIIAPEAFPEVFAEYGFAATVATGFVAGAVQTDHLSGGIYGAFSAGLFYGVGAAFESGGFANSWASEGDHVFGSSYNLAGFSAKVLAHGVAGGVMSSLEGGKFGSGFAAAGIADSFSGAIDHLDPGNPIGKGISAERIVASAILGGTASELAGGKFGNGALTGAFGRAFNDEMADFAQDRQVKRWANGEISTTQMAQSFNPCYGSSTPGICAATGVGIVLTAGAGGFIALDAAALAAPATSVFWSGGLEVAGATASSWAAMNGGVTLEMTAAGQSLTAATQGMAWTEAGPLWAAASNEFAAMATGEVHVFQATYVSTGSFWATIEYPALTQGGRVSQIIYHVLTDEGAVVVP